MSRTSQTTVALRELTTADEVARLEPLLTEYLRFVVGDIERQFGIVASADDAIASTMSKLDHVLPPKGATFAAFDGGTARGMVFLRSHGPDLVEIKRLYVQPHLRGTGAGRALVEEALGAARRMGVGRVVLDSTRNLAGALTLYESLGFRHCDPFPESDLVAIPELMPVATFMELRLDAEA